MVRRYLGLLGLCVAVHSFAAESVSQSQPRDLFLGEAFYHAQQGDYFDAITRLDAELAQYGRQDEKRLDPLHFHAGHAEFSVGDFELSYRMHQRAGRAIRAVLEGNVSPEIRNEAAYRLARIYYEKNEPAAALEAIEKITGKIPERIRFDEPFLRAQIYMVNNRAKDAIEILEDLNDSKAYNGFAGYNLGVALLQSGQEKAAASVLDKTGVLESTDESALAMRDKANLALGFHLLRAQKVDQAKQYLDRVRLEGPFSDKALLGSGWSDVAQGRFDRALVPWNILSKRHVTEKAVQESLLGVPYAYAQLNLHGRAALLYGSALESFGQELARLDGSIKSIHSGNFLKALVREEVTLDRNWVLKLRELPETPETYYLMELMASNDFQSSLQNYLDLESLRRRLQTWDDDLSAYEEIIALRRRYYEPLLPVMDKRFGVLDSQLRLREEQRQRLAEKLKQLLTMPRPDMLATADERLQREALLKLKEQYATAEGEAAEQLRSRIQRLEGRINWEIKTGYDQRLTDAYEHLHALEKDVAQLQKIYASYVRTRQAATQSYQGYDDSIRVARTRARAALDQVGVLMGRQGHMLEVMAVHELEQRRRRLQDYQVQARFAMAESYDRAVKAQQGAGAKSL